MSLSFVKRSVVLTLAMLCLFLVASPLPSFADDWTHRNYWDQNSQMQIVEVTSMVRHQLTCTVNWNGTYTGPTGPGAPSGNTSGVFTIVLPGYPGNGAAIVGRQGAKYISNFQYSIVCN